MCGVMDNDAPLLSTSAAATLLGISDETLRRWADTRKIRHVRLPSGVVKFRREDIEAILEPVEPAGETA